MTRLKAHELLAIDCAAPKLHGDLSKVSIITSQYKFVPDGCLRDEDVASLIQGRLFLIQIFKAFLPHCAFAALALKTRRAYALKPKALRAIKRNGNAASG